MQRNFDAVLQRVLREEGGYTNHSADPGGPTNWGITLVDARKYWKSNATAADVKAMPVEVAEAIYRHKYWDVLRCGQLPAGADYAVMDYGVNSGTGRASKVLRRVLGMRDDAPFADVAKVLARSRPTSVAADLCDERLRFLKSLKTWPTFGKGWGARVGRVRAAAIALALQSAPIELPKQIEDTAKGQVPLNSKGQVASTGGAVVSGGAAVNQAAQSGADLTTIVVLIALVIAVSTGAYLYWHWRQQRLQNVVA